MIKVVKFGGSSLASAEQFRKVKDIILSDPDRRFVVPSAPGKRDSSDTKVTDMLYNCYSIAEQGGDFTEALAQIHERYQGIIDGLSLSVSLESEFATIRENFAARAGRDYAASRGEYLNGILLANYLGFEFLDSAKYIRFQQDGTYDAKATQELLSKGLANLKNAVIPGFYGAYSDGRVKTFSRGGSDITGSIVARAVQANLYENWTDVSGFLVADPHIVKNPKVIETITYRELRELSYMGAGVLHEDAIFPVRTAGIPINIKNTNAPEDEGTFIVENTSRKPAFVITGIAGKKGFTAINIEKDMMNTEIGFGRKALQAFEDNGISFEHMPSGIDTLSVFVHQHEFEEKEQAILAEIHKLCNPDFIDISTDLALIAVVGRGMKSAHGTAAKIFRALDNAGVNIRMIDQGSSEHNIIIGVASNDFETAVNAIYQAFVPKDAE